MKNKKGFTLAETLIVLMVIGVIAAISLPSMSNGLNQTQIKAMYKKTYNEVANIANELRMTRDLPSTNVTQETINFFEKFSQKLYVNSYVSTGSSQVNSGNMINASDYKKGIKVNGNIYGSDSDLAGEVTSITTSAPSPWIITENNTAFSIMCGGTPGTPAPCETASQIASKNTQTEAVLASCAIVIVDVNGLSKGPNKFEPQAGPTTGLDFANSQISLSAEKELTKLTGDQYLIFIGKDGATAGPRNTTVTGRIVGGLK